MSVNTTTQFVWVPQLVYMRHELSINIDYILVRTREWNPHIDYFYTDGYIDFKVLSNPYPYEY